MNAVCPAVYVVWLLDLVTLLASSEDIQDVPPYFGHRLVCN